MNLADIKIKMIEAEECFADNPLVELMTFNTPHGKLKVLLSDRLRRKCRKGRVWKSVEMLTALKNAAYGFDPKASRSRGGADGVFCLDRNHKPTNSMIRKLFDQFLDKPDSLVSVLKETLGSDEKDWVPVRVVSHHMRLLGILSISVDQSQIVLVDYDNTK